MTRPKRSHRRHLKALTLGQLEEWLDGLTPPAPGVSQIDGFLAALVVSPKMVHPETWLWHIMGDRAKWALEGSVAAAATKTIIDRYNQISTALSDDPQSYAPIYMRTDDGEVLLEEWANGFFGGMRLALPAWKPFMTDLETAVPLAVILVHCTTMFSAEETNTVVNQEAEGGIADAWRVVPQLVSLLYEKCAKTRIANSG